MRFGPPLCKRAEGFGGGARRAAAAAAAFFHSISLADSRRTTVLGPGRFPAPNDTGRRARVRASDMAPPRRARAGPHEKGGRRRGRKIKLSERNWRPNVRAGRRRQLEWAEQRANRFSSQPPPPPHRNQADRAARRSHKGHGFLAQELD